MFPSEIASDAPKSEKKVFNALRDSLPSGYIVFFSQRLNTLNGANNRFWEGEADFIVFHPDQGYLVLEVKGGKITHDAQGWHSEDRHGNTHSIKDPGSQAQSQCRAIHNYLTSLSSYSGSNQAPPFEWGVFFSDAEVKEKLKTLELPKEKVLDLGDIRKGNIRNATESILTKASRRRGGQHFHSERFIRSIAPSLNLVPRLRDRIEEEALDLVRLTDRQKKLMQMVRMNPDVGIRGAAGTGKTMIAVERARRLAESGESVLFLCYNQSLARFIESQLEGVNVLTFHELCRMMAERAELNFEVPADHERQRIFWASSVQHLLDKALDLLPDARWDHVIVDEGQDFLEEWYTSVLELRNKESSTLWVLYDPNQMVYKGGQEDLANELGLTPCVLDENCRNTKNIGRRVSELLPGDLDVPEDAPEGEKAFRKDCSDPQDMKGEVQKILHNLVNEQRISPSSIVVLSPRLPETSDIWQEKTLGNIRLRLIDDPPQANSVRFSSLHRFKGLESEVVILCEVSPGSVGCEPEHLYVGCSRARHKLIEFHYNE